MSPHDAVAHAHTSTTTSPVAVSHPLDALTAAEITAGRAILEAAELVTETTRFPNVLPIEPEREAVAGFREGDPIDRGALLVFLRRLIADNRAGGWRKLTGRR